MEINEERNEWQEEYLPTIRALFDKIETLLQRLHDHEDKRDRAHDCATTAEVKGCEDMYRYWTCVYWYHYEQAKLLMEALSDLGVTAAEFNSTNKYKKKIQKHK